VKELLLNKEQEIRNLAKNLFLYDYLDSDDMDKVIRGEELPKDKVRTWNYEKEGHYIIKF
jgi:hypothetical protein